MTAQLPTDAMSVEEIKERTDLVELVRLYVPGLQRSGRSWKGLCPFHPEKTPSFHVTPHLGRYYCFGCKASGDAIGFLMQLERMSFVEACDDLARRLGGRFYGRDSTEKRGRKDLILEANGVAASHFAELLRRSDRAEEAAAYLERRRIAPASVERFQLGYSLPEWDALRGTLLGRGYEEGLLIEAGLLKPRDDGRGSYDRFRGRLMFPIRSAQSDVIGFGGRALGDDEPKYLNGPASPVFDKSRTLYGLDVAAEGLKAAGRALVVEGYTDVIACHEAGVTNAVATLGTALTPGHLAVLKRYVSSVVMAYDADSAGLSAVLRSAEELDASDLEVSVLLMPQGEDPDSLVRGSGPDRLRELVDQAAPLYEFVLDRLLPEPGRHPGRTRLTEVAERLAHVRSPVLRERYVTYAADRVCLGDAARMHALAAAMRREVRDAARRTRKSEDSRQTRSTESGGQATADVMVQAALAVVPVGVRRREEAVLGALAQETVGPEEVFGRIGVELFQDTTNRELAVRLHEVYAGGGSLSDIRVTDSLSAEASALWTRLALGHAHSARDREAVDDCIAGMLDDQKRARLAELEPRVLSVVATGARTDEERALLREYSELKRYFSDQAGRRLTGP